MEKSKNMKLDNRLHLCAQSVRNGARIADIGTDHAYLSIWLMKNKLISHAIAADLREGPLLNAQNNIKKYGMEQYIETRLSDGLDNINENEVDDIIIAGMGGELIINIIKRAGWLKNQNKSLILQPMSAEQELREFLFSEGFNLNTEKAVVSYGKVYSVMSVNYKGNLKYHDKLYPYIGPLTDNLTDEAHLYIEKEIRNLNNKVIGLNSTNQYEKAAFLRDIIDELKKI